MTNDAVKVYLKWDETYPGWKATAETKTYEQRSDGAVSIAEHSVTPELVHAGSVLVITNALDALGKEANIHPARMGDITVVFPAETLWDIRDRSVSMAR